MKSDLAKQHLSKEHSYFFRVGIAFAITGLIFGLLFMAVVYLDFAFSQVILSLFFQAEIVLVIVSLVFLVLDGLTRF